MNPTEKLFDQSPPIDHQRNLQAFFLTLTEMTQRHAQQIPGGIFSLDEEQQQVVIDKINPYFQFEFANHPELHNLHIKAVGGGMMYLSDLSGNIMGVETISDSDEVTGHITDVCILPTPTVECLVASDESGIPVTSQVLSPVIVLNGGIFKTNYSSENGFETEHNLSNFQTCLPLAHYLQISTLAS